MGVVSGCSTWTGRRISASDVFPRVHEITRAVVYTQFMCEYVYTICVGRRTYSYYSANASTPSSSEQPPSVKRTRVGGRGEIVPEGSRSGAIRVPFIGSVEE